MNHVTHIKELYSSLDELTRRTILIMLASLLLLVILYTTLSGHLAALDKRKSSREQTLTELLVLRQRYQEAAAEERKLSNRMATVTSQDSPVTVIEQSGIIPKTSIQSKPLPRHDRGAVIEENAEISLSGLSLNDTVNLLYYLEQGSKPLTIRKAVIRSRFNDQSKLDLILQVALFRASTPGKQ